GTAYTQTALDSLFPGFGPVFVAVALFLFAFTTLIAFNYIATSAASCLFRGRVLAVVTRIIQVAMIAGAFLGAIGSADHIRPHDERADRDRVQREARERAPGGAGLR